MHFARTLIVSLTAVFATQLAYGEDLAQQVRDAENGFAATMAKRDLTAFATFLADDAVFFGGNDVARGKKAVIAAWTPLYQDAKAPFSWKSESVEVLASGTLAHSSGPVLNAEGRRVATFNSIWRRSADGKWQVVFDKGCDACSCAQARAPGPQEPESRKKRDTTQ